MKVEIICIGDELLIGQTVNTNASWIGTEFMNYGVKVEYSSIVKDVRLDIINSLDLALNRSNIIIITGGLGPTKDDITKNILSEYFNCELQINNAVLKRVEKYFENRKLKILDVNINQALVPKGCKVLMNDLGTAPGMWFDIKGKVVVSLPGVPYEMKDIINKKVFPLLKNKFKFQPLFQKTILFQGVGESYIANIIHDLEAIMLDKKINFAYLPSSSIVRLRLSAKDNITNRELIDRIILKITERFPSNFFGKNEDTLSDIVGRLLINKKLTIGTVESCTGGGVSKEIVRVSGSSRYFKGSIICYSNMIKINLLDIQKSDLDSYGAVSDFVVKQMAINGRRKLGVDYCISVSGIAGPKGGSTDKPVGLVWIGIAGPKRVIAKKFLFSDNRDRNIIKSIFSALNFLRCELLGINTEKK